MSEKKSFKRAENEQICTAIDEINAVLDKHAMAGYAVVQDPTHFMVTIKVTPEWGALDVLQEDGKLIFKMKDGIHDPEELKIAASHTKRILETFSEVASSNSETFNQILSQALGLYETPKERDKVH